MGERWEVEDGGRDELGPGQHPLLKVTSRASLREPTVAVKHMPPALPSLGTAPYCEEDTWLICFFFHSRLNV